MTSIALIGPGRHGTAIASLFASHGISVTLYHHRPEKAQDAASAIRRLAQNAEITVANTLEEAVAQQEIIALTTLWDAPQRAVIVQLGDALQGKVLLDVSNPLDVTPAGVQLRTPAQGSAGEFVASLLPTGVGHVKAFSNLPTASILDGANRSPLAVLPFAADSAASADRIRPLLERIGWFPWLVGDISVSRELEIGGKYNTAHGRWGRARLDQEQMLQLSGVEENLSPVNINPIQKEKIA